LRLLGEEVQRDDKIGPDPGAFTAPRCDRARGADAQSGSGDRAARLRGEHRGANGSRLATAAADLDLPLPGRVVEVPFHEAARAQTQATEGPGPARRRSLRRFQADLQRDPINVSPPTLLPPGGGSAAE